MTRIRRGLRRGGTDHIWGIVLEGRRGGLAFGLILVGIGVVLLLEQQGLIAKGFWLYSWPWFLIIPSAVQLATARTASRVGSAVLFGLFGCWFIMVQSHWHGLAWANSWPLNLVAIGASIVAQAVAGVFLPEKLPRRAVIDDASAEEGRRDV